MPGQPRFVIKLLTSTLLPLFFICFCSSAFAVEPQPGRVYSGGTEISVSSLGIKFRIPGNWRGGLSPSGESFLMEPPDQSATLFAVADTMSADEAFIQMRGPVPLTDTIQLVLDGQVKRNQNSLAANYNIPFNPQLTARARGKATGNGTTVAFFLVSSRSNMKSLLPHLDSTYNSLSVIKQAVNTQAKTKQQQSSSDRSWLTYLKGKHIVRFFTGSGYHEEQHIWLCSNGQYVRRFDSGGFGGGASGAFQGNYDGSWTATGEGEYGKLILSPAGNQRSTYNLKWDYAKNHLYVDGKRWLHDKNAVCD